MHTLKHISVLKDSGAWLSSDSGSLHDRTIQIIALPCVYDIMSLKSVIRMWEVIGHVSVGVGENWKERKDFLTTMFERNFDVADLYETWASFQFAWLALYVLELQFHKDDKFIRDMAKKESPGEFHKIEDDYHN